MDSNWQEYCDQFKIKAHNQGYQDEYVAVCLNYAEKLFKNNLPIIYDEIHLSFLVGYQLFYLNGVVYNTSRYYRFFKIKKKSGADRLIAEPLPSLKEIQKWILDNILYKFTPSKFAKAFIPKRSIRENARFHKNQVLVLSLDIKDFFHNTKGGRVYKFFYNLGYQKDVAYMLTNICTLDSSLPQGAPTSPALSNLLNLRLDNKLSGFALKQNIRYTRYADDITFSGIFEPGKTINFVKKVLSQEGYELNEKKTRLMEAHQRQEVTGIVVNKKLQVSRKKRNELRKVMYFIEKYGIESHLQHVNESRVNYLKHLLGIANHFSFVNPSDIRVKNFVKTLKELIPKNT